MEQFIVRMVREKEDLEGKLKRANNLIKYKLHFWKNRQNI